MINLALLTISMILIAGICFVLVFILLKYSKTKLHTKESHRFRHEIDRSKKLKSVATLASGLAHEIKNPLTAIKTFTDYLPTKKNDPEFLDKFSKIVGSEVDRVDGLVHQLLEFAKPSPLTIKNTDIHRLIDETLNFLSSKFIQQNIKVEKDFDSGKIILSADPNQLRQAFLNIFLNAADAMNKNGTLTIKTRMIRSEFEISTSDTGCGIDPKDLLHIFDPFFSKKDGGAGLGLAITHGIIKEHGGNIHVESKLGVGTTFIIELPYKQPEPP